MIEKAFKKRKLSDSQEADDLAYWLGKTPEERIAAVEFLRRQYYGYKDPPRLQRVARIVKRK